MSRRVIVALGSTVAAVVLFVAIVLVVDSGRGDRIADGVTIGGIPVGGVDRLAALERVQEGLGDRVATKVELTRGTRTFVVTPQQAGARLDVEATVDEALDRGREGSNAFSRVLGLHEADVAVEPKVTISRPAVRRFARTVAAEIDREPRDADIAWTAGRLEKTKARTGRTVKQSEVVDTVIARMRSTDGSRRVAVPMQASERPDETLTDLAEKYPTVITVDRGGKKLRLYEGLKLARTYDVAVGKEGNETTPGRYKIQSKQTDPVWNVPQSDWAGSLAGQTIPAGDPRNPLKARWMGFNGSQGIHGTDDIASLGSTASHGCIRMNPDDVTALYDDVETGTPVFVQ